MALMIILSINRNKRSMETKLIKGTVIILLIGSCYSFQSGTNAQTPDHYQGGDLKLRALTILQTKCNVCHQTKNPRKVFTNDNMGVLAPKIYKQVFVKRRMPKGDEIKLTAQEEQVLMSWLQTQVLTKD
jgi:uncharacterized membrane protein